MRSPFPQPLSWCSLVYLYFILHTFLHQIIIFLPVTKRIFSYYCTTTTTTLYPFNGLFSRTTWVSRYQKGKTSLYLNEVGDERVLGWQWYQLDHMQTICTSLQTDNHTNTSSLNFTGRVLFLAPSQQCQSTEGTLLITVMTCEFLAQTVIGNASEVMVISLTTMMSAKQTVWMSVKRWTRRVLTWRR